VRISYDSERMTQDLNKRHADRVAFRASFLHCLSNPALDGDAAVEYHEDAVLLVEEGRVRSLTPTSQSRLPADTSLIDLSGKLIVPGFIDTHIHFPQVDIIASHGTQLLEWLERYTFPAEMRFADADVAADAAEFFLDELLRCGTTTALVFGTVHAASVNAFFTAALSRRLRMICGKVMMDRHAPAELCDTAESSYADSLDLIKAWHGVQRLGYAVTPRFAPTSSDAQLAMAERLLQEFPDVHLHTHIAENKAECDWVSSLFPDKKDYLAVYEHYGLVRKRAMFAHAIHLPDEAWQRLARADAAVAHCPTSNLFIGSGLFNMQAAMRAGVKIGLGTDVGGGDSFSILRTYNEAYKVQQLQHYTLPPEQGLYMATLGGALALDLDRYIGNFSQGKEADFVVLDEAATPLLKRRSQQLQDWRERLFMLMMLGDDRCVFDTYVMGESRKPVVV